MQLQAAGAGLSGGMGGLPPALAAAAGIPPGAGMPGMPHGLQVSQASLLMQGGFSQSSMASMAAAAHLNSIRSGLNDAEVLRRHEELSKLSKFYNRSSMSWVFWY